MQGALCLDVVVGQSVAILERLPSKDQSLLVCGNIFLVMDLRLNTLNGIRGLNIHRKGEASQCLDKDLHPCSMAQ